MSPLLKYTSIIKENPTTGKKYQVAIAIRENGRIEFYSDFILVNEYTNPRLQCIDIESDFDKFYLKFVMNADEVTEDTKEENLKLQIRYVRHLWRNRISFSTTKKMVQYEKWNWVIDKRIANYFKLYTTILNFSMFMLISHRNMISVFDMTAVTSG